MKNSQKNKTITLNCGVQGCCPQVKMKEKNVIITDDYGGKVKMTRDQWNYFVGLYIKKKQ